MADSDEVVTEDDLIHRHKKERKELQAHIQQLKHSVPKGDKKRKKEVTTQIAQLEAELDQKHEQQLKDFRNKQVDEAGEQIQKLTTDSEPDSEKPKRSSKAQKRRDKKAIQNQEREERIQEQEIENITGSRNVEAEKLKTELKKRNLAIFEIPSDGNCLYTALIDQLNRRESPIKTSWEALRKQTAEHMLSNREDFMPFLSNQNTGEPFTEEEFEKYCSDVATTAAWGGQLEIRALSNVLRIPIEVVQADIPSLTVGEEHKEAALILSYHRHMYGLGEHYNSVIDRPESDEDEFS